MPGQSLFVRLRGEVALDDDLTTTIRQRIRRKTMPRHVPAEVVQVTDIPRIISGKIVELAVREIIHAREVKNVEALASPMTPGRPMTLCSLRHSDRWRSSLTVQDPDHPGAEQSIRRARRLSD